MAGPARVALLCSWLSGCGVLVDAGDEQGLRSGPDASLESGPPNLVFYRSSDGALAPGRVDADGSVFTYATTKAPSGWETVVATSDKHVVGFVPSAGTRQLATLGGTPAAPTLSLSPSEDIGTKWTSLSRYGSDSLLAYARSDGTLRIESMTTGESHAYPPPSAEKDKWVGYDLMAVTRNNSVLLYAEDGRAMYCRLGPSGPIEVKANPGWTTQWAFIVPDAADRWFLYKKAKPDMGDANLARAGIGGVEELVAWVPGESPLPIAPLAYTAIISTSKVMLFRLDDVVNVGTISSSGVFVALAPERRPTIDASWTHVVSLE